MRTLLCNLPCGSMSAGLCTQDGCRHARTKFAMLSDSEQRRSYAAIEPCRTMAVGPRPATALSRSAWESEGVTHHSRQALCIEIGRMC